MAWKFKLSQRRSNRQMLSSRNQNIFFLSRLIFGVDLIHSTILGCPKKWHERLLDSVIRIKQPLMLLFWTSQYICTIHWLQWLSPYGDTSKLVTVTDMVVRVWILWQGLRHLWRYPPGSPGWHAGSTRDSLRDINYMSLREMASYCKGWVCSMPNHPLQLWSLRSQSCS